LPAAQVPRVTLAEAGEAEPVEPSFRLRQRLAALDPAEPQTERDIVARRLPRQQRVVLEQDAELVARQFGLDRAGERRLQPDDSAQQARFARTGWSDEADKAARIDGQIDACEDRLFAIGDRQFADTQLVSLRRSSCRAARRPSSRP
jgi:hypothetical protein